MVARYKRQAARDGRVACMKESQRIFRARYGAGERLA